MTQPTVERLPTGTWSIPVPIPDNPLGHTLVYVLDSDDGPVLVDAGWDDPASLAALESGLATAGTSLSEVVGLLVTHHHPDHHGLAGAVREASGAWIAMHTADVEVVRWINQVFEAPTERRQGHMAEVLHAAGAPAEEVDAVAEQATLMGTQRPAIPDRELTDGDVIRLGGRSIEAVWTPGHSPGHTCFWLDDTRQLLAGDHLLPTISPHVGLYGDDPEADPLGAFLSSLDRIRDLGPDEVLPAHQYRFVDASSRVDELHRHHEERLGDLLSVLASADAMSLWDLAATMTWNRPWEDIPVMMRRVALGEAAAHVRHLVVRGLVEPIEGDDGQFRRTAQVRDNARPQPKV